MERIFDAANADGSLRAAALTAARTEVLRETDLHILPGELFVLLGAAESGKSSVLRAIAGLDRLSGGEIRLDGQVISRVPARRRDIALMLQSFPLWPHLDVAENVAFAVKGRGLNRQAARQRVMRELAFVGLGEFARHLPSQLTPGQRQRVALARTLAADRHLCLLDEPFSALDPLIRRQLQDQFIELSQMMQKTTIFITHDLDLAASADRIVHMIDGRIDSIEGGRS